MKFPTVRKQLIFWLLVIGLIPLISGMCIFYIQQVKLIKRETSEHLEDIRNVKIRELQNWLDQRTGDLHVISGDYEIRGLEHQLSQNINDEDAFPAFDRAEKLLLRNKLNYPDYRDLMIVDPESGIARIATSPELVASNHLGRKYLSQPLQTHEISILDIRRSGQTNKPEMVLSAPIFCLNHGNHVIGVLVAFMDLDVSLYPLLLNRVGMGSTGETLIVSRDMMALNELRWVENAPLNLRITAEPAMLGASGQTGLVTALDYRGEKVVAAYSYLPSMQWGFVAKQDTAEIFRPVYQMIVRFFLILLVSTLLVFLLSLYLSGSITRPLTTLTDYAKRITRGDTDLEVPVGGSGEIKTLGMALDKMTRTLSKELTINQESMAITQSLSTCNSPEEAAGQLLTSLKSKLGCHLLVFYGLVPEDRQFEVLAFEGTGPGMEKTLPRNDPPGHFGLLASSRQIHSIHTPEDHPRLRFVTASGEILPKELIGFPVLDGDQVVGLVSMAHLDRFPEYTEDLLMEIWPYINASFNRLIAAKNLEQRNEELKVAYSDLETQSTELQEQTNELRLQSNILQDQNLQLEQKTREVEEANRLKSEFLSNVSHELRTPLNSILNLSNSLSRKSPGSFTSKDKSHLEIIERNGRNLLKLINDILDFSKIEAGKLEIKYKSVNINEIIQAVVENQNQAARLKKLKISTIESPDLPRITTDELRVHQILTNLVDNAIKYTEAGKVTVRSSLGKECIRVEVEDTGIGIRKEDQTRIFEHFTQLDGSTTRRYEGTGLGLAIVKKLTDLLHGNIQLTSEPGKGTLFALELPLGSPVQNEKPAGGRVADPKAGPLTIKGKRILIVEDNEHAIEQIRPVLEERGAIVDVARDGMESLEIIQIRPPDAIILDLMMPEIDGFEVLNQIRSNPAFHSLPVMILTAKDLTSDDMEQLTSNHVHEFVQKGDIDMRQLVQKVNELFIQKGP